ncbi:MAG: glucosaminidase domain-containing protein [Erysipelotrichaceae bacterium]|nr:glucosaminidase domain-containing protein [Erysipelotrichaceae bacterium]
MKKYFSLLLTVLILISIMPMNDAFKLAADEYYSMACEYGKFEVSYIEDDGSFTAISCHDSFDEAKKAMKANDDYVVRYAKSYSPSKIVAMNGGVAYSYPGRRNSSVMYLYQDPSQKDNSRYKSTYVSNHYEMTYIETCGSDVYDISTGGKGYIRVVLNGFEGYTDLEYTDLVPYKFLNKGLSIWLGGKNTYESEDPFLVKPAQNYYELKNNGKYVDLVYHYYRAYPKSSSDRNALSYSLTIDNGTNYLAAGMSTEVRYYSNDGINFYSDQKLKNKVATVYNYYQFLPLRTKTNIAADKFDSFLKSMNYSNSVMTGQGSIFIDAQNKYGCNALLVYAMACLESAYGTSWYAVNRNNLFGWSAYDDSPSSATTFSSVAVCVNEQMGRNLNWFLDYSNSRYFGSAVGNKGAGVNVKYASDPYWGLKIAAIAYSIDKYANGSNGKLSDHNSYALGFVADNYNDVLYNNSITWDPNFYREETGNNVLYTGRYGSHYQKDLTVVLLQEGQQRYKVQSTNPIVNGAISTDDGVIKYDWNASIAYIDKKYVTLLNNVNVYKPEPELEHEQLTLVFDMNIDNAVLSLNGIGLLSNLNMTDQSLASHSLYVYDLENETVSKQIECETIDSGGYSINDGFDYKWAGFKASVVLNELSNGSYILQLESAYNGVNKGQSLLKSYNDDKAYLCYEDDEHYYIVRLNDLYGYRIEIDVTDKSLDYASVNKTSVRSSLVTLDSVTYEQEEDKVYALFEGLGMIYYLNYDLEDNMHQLYLVNGEKALKVETKSQACSFDYKSFYGSSFNMDKICYSAKADLSELQGDYKIILEINNGEYKDIAEVTNEYEHQYQSYESDAIKTSFKTDKVRYRMILSVEQIEQ